MKLKNTRVFVFVACSLLLACSAFISCKSADVPEGEIVYNKVVHPREYYFDIYDLDNELDFITDKDSGKLVCSVDFTKFVKEDLPQAGDKLIFQYKGYSYKDMTGNILASIQWPAKDENGNFIDISNNKERVFATDLKKKEIFEGKVSFILPYDLEEVVLNLRFENYDPNKKIYFTFYDTIESTNTKQEKKEEARAIKEEHTIIEWKKDIVDDYLAEDMAAAEADKNQPGPRELYFIENDSGFASVIESTDKDIQGPIIRQGIAETKEKLAEIYEEDLEEKKALEEAEKQKAIEQAALKKQEEERLAEEKRKREEAERKALEEQRLAEEEERRLAEEAKEQERIKQEKELKEHQRQLEETIETVSKSDVSRYEKEYLNDYAVDEYTFDMETTEIKTPDLFENPDEVDDFGRTLLMKAAKDGNDWQIRALVNAGADVNMKDNDGWTALMYAVRYQENMDCVELLINGGAEIKTSNNFGTSALILAANYNNNPEILKQLLSYYTPTDRDVLQSFILVLTENVASEYMQMIKVDLFLGMSVPLNSFYQGKTPLMYSAEAGNSTHVLKQLLDAGSITSLRSTEGKTAFDYAKENPKLKHDDIYWSLNNK